MPKFRCDFDVTGDLVLPNNVNELELAGFEGFVTTLKNGSLDEDGNATGLVVTIIGSTESIEYAHQELRSALAEQLDLLAFVTRSRFKIDSPRRVVEWEQGRQVRRFQA